MDRLGERIIKDRDAADELRKRAEELEREARELRWQADEIDRLLELARFALQ